MLLFQKRFHAGLVSGAVTLTFRRWPKARVKVGGRYRCHPIGVLEVDAVERTTVGALVEDDARRGGFASLAELCDYLASGPFGPVNAGTELFRIALHHGGDGDRVPLALDTALDDAGVAAIEVALAKLDADAPWTADTLSAIVARPRVAASQLAASLGRETAPFKEDVRKLKRLGLTQSFEVGYELSPRGAAFLAARGAAAATVGARQVTEITRPSRPSARSSGKQATTQRTVPSPTRRRTR